MNMNNQPSSKRDTFNGIVAAIVLVLLAVLIYFNTTASDDYIADYDDDFDKTKIVKANPKPKEKALDRKKYAVPSEQLHDIIKAKKSDYVDGYIPVNKFDPYFHNAFEEFENREEIFGKDALYEDNYMRIDWVFAFTQDDSPEQSDFETIRIYIQSKVDKTFRVRNKDFGIMFGDGVLAEPTNTTFDYVKLKGQNDVVAYDLHFQIPNNLNLFKIAYSVNGEAPESPTQYYWQLVK